MENTQELLEFLASTGKIEENETLESLFQRPYKNLEEIFISALESAMVFYHSNILRPFYALILAGASMMIEEEKQNFKNYQSKTNANKIVKWLQGDAFLALAPQLLSLFEWDFNRKDFGKPEVQDKLKKEFIRNTLIEIERELNGASKKLTKKYGLLLLEFIDDFTDKFPEEVFKDFNTNWKNRFFELKYKISEVIKNGNIDEFVDEELEQSISSQVSEKSKLIKSGKPQPFKQFDFISNAFAYALIEYQVYLEQMLQNLGGTDEKMPLQDVLKKAKDYCGNDDLEMALNLLLSHAEITQDEKFENDLIHQKARWKYAKRDERLGVVSKSDNDVTFNQIRMSVLELITEISKNYSTNRP